MKSSSIVSVDNFLPIFVLPIAKGGSPHKFCRRRVCSKCCVTLHLFLFVFIFILRLVFLPRSFLFGEFGVSYYFLHIPFGIVPRQKNIEKASPELLNNPAALFSSAWLYVSCNVSFFYWFDFVIFNLKANKGGERVLTLLLILIIYIFSG